MMRMPHWKQSLISGYNEFRESDFKLQKEEYASLGQIGQSPKIMVIACSDSRVNPSAIFHAHPGQLFTLRNIANIVPPYTTQDDLSSVGAAIEYAVLTLKVEAIVVMGHESCGGIQAYLEDIDETKQSQFVGSWISLLDDAHTNLISSCNIQDDKQKQMEFAGIRQSLLNLTRYPCVKKALESGELSLLGAYFSIVKGVLMFLDDNGDFQEVPTRN